jgi:hypothetical protein
MAALKRVGSLNIWMISFAEFIEEEIGERNPTIDELKNLARREGGLRFLISNDGNLYVAPGQEIIHYQLARNVGLDLYTDVAVHGFIYADGEGFHYTPDYPNQPAAADWERHLKNAGFIFH